MNPDKIYDMYVKMIRRGRITLMEVPEEYRAEVKRRLENA